MRRTAAISLLLFLFAGSAAWAQTTSSSTTVPASTTLPPTTTTATPVTTIPGATEQPPGATLTSAAGQVRGVDAGSCWRRPNTEATTCTRVQLVESLPVLAVRHGETLTLAFQTAMAPTAVDVQRLENLGGPAKATLSAPAANPSRFRADLPTGVWFLFAATDWAQGDATYAFKVDVRAPNLSPPATPTPAAPRFTG